MNIFNSWQFFVILNILLDVVFTQSYKLAVRKVKNYSAATVVLESIAGLSILCFIPFFVTHFSTNLIIYLLFLLSILAGALNDRLKTVARKFLPASESAILNQLPGALVIFIGITALGQSFIFTKIIGAILIFSANILLVYRQGQFRINKYTIFFIIACIASSVTITIDIGITKYFNLAFYISFEFLISALIIYVSSRSHWKEIRTEFSQEKKYYFLTGIAWSAGFLSLIRAAQLAPIIVVIPLAATSVLVNVLTASFVHEETKYIVRKVIAALIVIMGITLTVLR